MRKGPCQSAPPACSGAADETAETTDTAEVETIDDAAAAETAAVLDANTATAEQLAALDGVSDELAAAIVSGQPYASVTDLNAALLETLGEDEAQGLLVNAYCSNTRLSTCVCRGRGWNDLGAGVHRMGGRNNASPLRRAITFSGE